MISGAETDKQFNITIALLWSHSITFAKQCKSFLEIENLDHVFSKLLVESKWQIRLQDRLDEFSTNATEQRSEMIEKCIQLQKYLIQNSKYYISNYNLGYCGQIWGRDSKGHLFYGENYLFLKENIMTLTWMVVGFLGGSVVRDLSGNAGDAGSIP